MIVDEIGTMELASPGFREAIRQLFERATPLVATVPLARQPFVDEFKRRGRHRADPVGERNREALPLALAARLAA